MTTIQSTRELPTCALRGYDQIKDEADALRIANGRKSYLYHQTAKALYLFCEISESEK